MSLRTTGSGLFVLVLGHYSLQTPVCFLLVLLKVPSDVKLVECLPLLSFISACFVLNSRIVITKFHELLFISEFLTLELLIFSTEPRKQKFSVKIYYR